MNEDKYIIDDLKLQIEQIKDKHQTLISYNAKQRAEIIKLNKQVKPFLDLYFKDLPMESIAELAKKSIRLTKYNSELQEMYLNLIGDTGKWQEKYFQAKEKLEKAKKNLVEIQEEIKIARRKDITEYTLVMTLQDTDELCTKTIQEIE